jgi:hypothetical protein
MDIVEAEPREWLIRKGGFFYRPKRSGYTDRKVEAGRYTESEARREAAVEPWHMSAVHQDEVPDEPAVADMSATITALRARVAELEGATARQLLAAVDAVLDHSWANEDPDAVDAIVDLRCARAALRAKGGEHVNT